MNGRGADTLNHTIIEKHDFHAARENGNLNALDLLAQAPKMYANSYQSNEQQTQRCVDKHALPSLTIDEKPYVRGYDYTKSEAEVHQRDILKSGSSSEEDLNFMKALLKQQEREHDVMLSDVVRRDGKQLTNGDKSDDATRKHEPLQLNARETKFELSTEAEKVAWEQWQVKLNEQIGKALDKLVAEGKIPIGANGNASYTVANDGRYGFNVSAHPFAYRNVIMSALNDTFNHHRDLLKFPSGAHKDQITRNPTFSVGNHSSVYTGSVEDEVIKR